MIFKVILVCFTYISKNKKETVIDYWKKYIFSIIKSIIILSNTLIIKIKSLLKYTFSFSKVNNNCFV